uniref:Tail assembly chaperone n=2 Tax=unclassified bacterial viruses TaxID=12333 RepID=A0AAU7J7Y9_9VIRU
MEPTFESLLAQMSELSSIPLDARDQFDAMLRANFTGQINDDEEDDL